jgi:pimeloyl-ACP methyl ester carboxylesterase
VLVGTDLAGVPLDPAMRELVGVAICHARAGDLDAAREGWLAAPLFEHSPAAAAAALRAIVDDYTFWHWTNPNPHVWLDPPSGLRGAEVGVPTLVVWGEHDVDQIIDNCERMARDIPGARTVVLDGAGHMANMDAPAAFDAALLDFLAARP